MVDVFTGTAVLIAVASAQVPSADLEEVRAGLEYAQGAIGLGRVESAREALLEVGGMLTEAGELGSADWMRAAEELVETAVACDLVPVQVEGWRWIMRHYEHVDDRASMLDAKMRLARAQQMLGDHSLAVEHYRELNAIWSEELEPDDPYLLTVRGGLGQTLVYLGYLEEGRELIEELVEILENTTRTLDPGYSLNARSSLAVIYREQGEYARAIELRDGLIEDLTEIHGPDSVPVLRERMNNYAARSTMSSDLSDVEEMRDILEGLVRLLPREHPLVLNAMIIVHAELRSDFAAARAVAMDALPIARQVWPQGSIMLATLEFHVASDLYVVGDLARAADLAAANLAWLEANAPSAPLVKHVTDLVGCIYLSLDEPDVALEHFERAMALATSTDDISQANLATALALLGRLEESIEILRELSARLSDGGNYSRVLNVRRRLAEALAATGRSEEALAIIEEVHEGCLRTLPPCHEDTLESSRILAHCRYATGDFTGALDQVRALLEDLKQEGVRLQYEAPRHARAVIADHLERLSSVLSLLGKEYPDGAPVLDGLAFEALESLRLASTASPRVTLEVSKSDALREQHDKLAEIRRSLNDLVARSVRDSAWRRELVRLSNERDSIERDLREQLAEHGVGWTAPDVAQIASALDDGSALVSFLVCTNTGGTAGTEGERSLLALVVTPDAKVRRVDIGAGERIEEAVKDWREALGRPLMGRGVTNRRDDGKEAATRAGEELRALVLDPILEHLPALRRLHVIPDDVLFLVPFDALPLKDGVVGDELVVQPHTAVTRFNAIDLPRKLSSDLVLVGDVDYDARGARPGIANLDIATPPVHTTRSVSGSGEAAVLFAPLAAALAEVEGIADEFVRQTDREAVLLAGSDATRAALHDHARRARFLHIATHGWFAPDEIGSSPNPAAELIGGGSLVTGFAPETLCGLALTGANHGIDGLGRIEGLMTAEELATLDLSGCELAVLSACETNVGIRRAGQGVQSLQTALHAAGVRASLASLWKVDDAATARLMQLFYANLWGRGLSKAEALWNAKTTLREEGAPVRDWAGWSLMGDAR